jgi:hypothetical protein
MLVRRFTSRTGVFKATGKIPSLTIVFPHITARNGQHRGRRMSASKNRIAGSIFWKRHYCPREEPSKDDKCTRVDPSCIRLPQPKTDMLFYFKGSLGPGIRIIDSATMPREDSCVEVSYPQATGSYRVDSRKALPVLDRRADVHSPCN